MLLSNHSQGKKSFEKWSQEISNAAKLISYTNYDWQQAAVDAMLLQTSNSKLREHALQDNVTYDELVKLGISKEQSAKGAALLEQASGQTATSPNNIEQEVRRLKIENKHLKSQLRRKACSRCGSERCSQGKKCPANGQECSSCKKSNHFAKVCRSTSHNLKKSSFGQISSADESDSEESSGRIVVEKLDSNSFGATITVEGTICPCRPAKMTLDTDPGISKTLLNRGDWEKIKGDCMFVRTSKRFRPYGTSYHLPIK